MKPWKAFATKAECEIDKSPIAERGDANYKAWLERKHETV